jgi:hypothetical protein
VKVLEGAAPVALVLVPVVSAFLPPVSLLTSSTPKESSHVCREVAIAVWLVTTRYLRRRRP